MTISDYIQQIATNAFSTGYGYYYARNADFNILGDNISSPVIVCIEPDQQYLNLSSLTGNIADGYNLFIRFLQRITNVDIADIASTRVTAIDQQKKNAALFISQLSNDDLFLDLSSVIPIITVIEAYDGNWYGVEINLKNLQLIQPIDTCS